MSKIVKKTIFEKNSGGAYHKCFMNDWLEDISSHMDYKKRKNNNFWNKENCQKEALKYNKISDFAYNSKGAYKAVRKNGWSPEIYSHMKKLK